MITGASQGFGAALVDGYRKLGYAVVGTSRTIAPSTDPDVVTVQGVIELHGYSALGVAEICKAAGVPKGSFYYFFESKQAMALAVIDEHWEAQCREWNRVLHGDAAPLQRLRELFAQTEASLRTGQRSCGTVSGCLFGNLTLELSNQAEAIRERLQQIFDTQVEMVEKVITEAAGQGDVSVADTRTAARSVVAHLEGQVLFAKLYNNTQLLGTLWSDCLSLLGARAPGPPSTAVPIAMPIAMP